MCKLTRKWLLMAPSTNKNLQELDHSKILNLGGSLQEASILAFRCYFLHLETKWTGIM